MITQKELKDTLSYNHDTGEFTWKKCIGRKIRKGDKAGNDHSGYIRIVFNGRNYRAHRLAFLYMTGSMPESQVDHINGNRADNRWSNLRRADFKINSRNKPKQKNNTSGVCGVSYNKNKKLWVALIGNDGRSRYLGYYRDWFDAVCARKSAEVKHGYHENHGREAR